MRRSDGSDDQSLETQRSSRHHLLAALVVSGCTFAVTILWLKVPVRLILSWDVFALTSVLLALGGMLSRGAKARVRDARNQDYGRAAFPSQSV